MPLSLSTRTRSATLSVVCLHRAAHASTRSLAPDCSVSGDTLNCRLQSILHFLYGAAGFLAFILLIVIAASIHIYRKNKSNRRDPA